MVRKLFTLVSIVVFLMLGFKNAFSISQERIIIVPPVIQEESSFKYDSRVGKLVHRGINNGIMKSNANSSKFFYSIVRKVTPSKRYKKTILSFYQKYQQQGLNFLSKVSRKYRVRYVIFGFAKRENGKLNVEINIFDRKYNDIYTVELSSTNDKELLESIENSIYNSIER
ncbi:MAG: hypothetical protein ABGX27_07120 [Desulfurobacteriaceae bacterium]